MSYDDLLTRRILIVDDSEGSRYIFSSWLRRAGYDVVEAATGAEAIELLTRTRFDMAVLDVNLPDMSGFDVCAHIKDSRPTAAIPVLHVSATAVGTEDRSEGLNRGADGYLIEPVERDELLATVMALLRYYDARRTAERLAARLEQLHQTTLLVNAAGSITELIRLAATGAAAIFAQPAIVVLVRDGRGWIARTTPDDVEPFMQACPPDTATTLLNSAGGDQILDMGVLDLSLDVPFESPGHISSVTTPRGELVGAIVLPGPLHSPDDDLMLDHFSQAVAVAMENQRLFALEHQIALTLQQAMLPSRLPQFDHLDIAVCYQASGETVEIGGDFYEVMDLGGRALIAIGDVVGHSLQAATVMAELRHSLRAFVLLGLESAEIVRLLDTVMSSSYPDLTATICLAEIDPTAQQLSITNAGHIPPFIYDGAIATSADCRMSPRHSAIL